MASIALGRSSWEIKKQLEGSLLAWSKAPQPASNMAVAFTVS